jgi:hypothetical protein
MTTKFGTNDKHSQVRAYCRAEFTIAGKPPFVEYGRGKTYEEAEASARRRVLKKNPNWPIEGWIFQRHTLTPPRFKVGDKVRWVEGGMMGQIHKVLALPDGLQFDGCVCFDYWDFGGMGMPSWADQDCFELVNDATKTKK